MNRPLTPQERDLATWMLDHGQSEALQYKDQLALAEVTPRKCPCGCVSFRFEVKGMPPPPPGVHVLGDYVFLDGQEMAGIFIYSSAGILSGVEVVGYGADAAKQLPAPAQLMTYEEYGRKRD